jgi:hypothetical protein
MTRFQSIAGVDPSADITYDASAFEPRDPAVGTDCRRQTERRRPHHSQQIPWMDWCVRNPNTNLVRSKRRARPIFDPKHLRWFAECVVDNSSHAYPQRRGAEGHSAATKARTKDHHSSTKMGIFALA